MSEAEIHLVGQNRAMRLTSKYALGVTVCVGIICAVLVIRFLVNRISCTTEEKIKIDNLSGVSIEVTDTICDTIAKDENIRVYVRKVDPEGAGLLSRWRNQRTLLFRYDPGSYDNPLPSVTRPSQSMILISIPIVGEIIEQRHQWESIAINYEIGRVINSSLTK